MTTALLDGMKYNFKFFSKTTFFQRKDVPIYNSIIYIVTNTAAIQKLPSIYEFRNKEFLSLVVFMYSEFIQDL